MITKNQWIFPLILVSSLIIFAPSFNYYFFQDDWFVLNWVKTQGILSFFDFRTDIIYWRPLTMPVFFALGNFLFGLKPLGYHLITFGFHMLNAFLVYLLFKELKISDVFAKFASFIYATSAFHFIGLSWLSTTSYIIGPTFILSTILFFLKRKVKKSFIFFLLALASSEFFLVIIPLIMLVLPRTKKTLVQIAPLFVVTVFYLVLRFVIFPVPASGQYEIELSPKILINTFWYFVWTFNIAEKFSSIFFVSNISAAPTLIAGFLKELFLPALLLLTFFVTLFISKIKLNNLIFGAVWFLIGIAPVILIPRHTYPIYLALASIGPIYAFTLTLEKISQKNYIIPVLIGSAWFLASFITVNFTRQNHWIANEQAISASYISFAKSRQPNPKTNSIFIFRPASIDFSKKNNFTLVETEDNIKQALNDQDGVKVSFSDQSLISLYLKLQENANTGTAHELVEIAPR